MNKIFYIFLFLALVSCKKDHEVKKDEWDYLNSSFNNKENLTDLTMHCMYDLFSVKRINDSLFYIRLDEFQGWKKNYRVYEDTVKLSENKKITDSLGNQKKQILRFSNSHNVDLEIEIHKIAVHFDSVSLYEYNGRVSINNKKLRYTCEDLFVK